MSKGELLKIKLEYIAQCFNSVIAVFMVSSCMFRFHSPGGQAFSFYAGQTTREWHASRDPSHAENGERREKKVRASPQSPRRPKITDGQILR